MGKLSNAHTPAPSYVAQKINLFIPKFVQKALDDDPGVWASWRTPTQVGVTPITPTHVGIKGSAYTFCVVSPAHTPTCGQNN